MCTKVDNRQMWTWAKRESSLKHTPEIKTAD
jgi:hypothetical protein